MTQYTYSDAKVLVDVVLLDYFTNESINESQVSLMNNLMNADVVVRDYFLGQPEIYGVENLIDFCNIALHILKDENTVAIKSVLASWQYEMGDTTNAYVSLAEALDTDINYSFANLIGRVMQAGWPAFQLGKMRSELHPKVIEQITSDELILA